MNDHNDGFEDVINHGYGSTPHPGLAAPTATIPAGPYGAQPVKPGLTKRGKVVLAIGAAFLVTTGSLFWVHHTDTANTNAVKAQELAIQKAEIDLETLKEMNRANTANNKAEKSQNTARQKQIDTCVTHNKGLVGKQLGATYRSVLEDCQAQYPDTSSGGDMQNAASAQDTNTGGGDAGEGLLVAGAVLAGGVFLVVRKAKTAGNPA